MATISVIDGDGNLKYLDVDGAGTIDDPYRPKSSNSDRLATILRSLARPTWLDSSIGALMVRVVSGVITTVSSVTAVTTVATVTTVTSVTAVAGVTNIGGVDAKTGLVDVGMSNRWCSAVRGRIT